MSNLKPLGFSPFFENQITNNNEIPARIAAEHRGGYKVWSQAGEGTARLARTLARRLEGEEFPGVGDWVTVRSSPAEDQIAIIDRVLTRRTVFVRGAPGRQTRGQVVAANVDIVFIVCGLDSDYSTRRIERYLARIWASGADPVVILNKADICDEAAARTGEVNRSCLGVPVHLLSARRGEGVDDLRAYLGQGITAAFVGSSGVGKSTLINWLLGENKMPTRDVSSRDGRGRHTTTHRQLILLPHQGMLVDTPGMRELQLLDNEGIASVFSDIERLSAECRFRDCTHQLEPGCAVRSAIDAGEVSPERRDHYLRLEAEARAFEIRHDERRRREADRALGKRYARDAATLRRWKQGR